MGVLIYGDPEDYRKPSIQRFTAPYFFRENQYEWMTPSHYQNATSLAVIGETICTLEKGENNPKILIQVETHYPPPPAPAPVPSPPLLPPEKDEYVCRLGFSTLLDKVTDKTAFRGATALEVPEVHMRLLVNDEPIR
jgi:hypothetical protein